MSDNKKLVAWGVTVEALLEDANKKLDEFENALNSEDVKLIRHYQSYFQWIFLSKFKEQFKHLCKRIITILYNYITKVPYKNQGIIQGIYQIINMITDHNKLMPKDLILPLEPMLQAQKYLIKILNQQTFECHLNFYFSDEDNEKLLKEHLPKIGHSNDNSAIAAAQLFRYLHPKFLPRVIDIIFTIIKERESGFMVKVVCNYLFMCTRQPDFKVDLLPYMDTIFEAIFAYSGFTFQILDVGYVVCDINSDFKDKAFDLFRNRTPNCLIALLTSQLQKGPVSDSIISHLKSFIPLLAQFIGSKQSGLSSIKFVSTFINLMVKAKKIHYVDPDIASQTIEIFAPLMTQAIMSTESAKLSGPIVHCLVKALSFNYEVIRDQIGYFAIENMYDSEMTFLAQNCILIVHEMIPFIFSNEHIADFEQYIPHIFDTIETLIGFDRKSTTAAAGRSMLAKISACVSLKSVSEDNFVLDYMCRKAVSITENLLRSMNAYISPQKPNQRKVHSFVSIFQLYYEIIPESRITPILELIESKLNSSDCPQAEALSIIINNMTNAHPKKTIEFLLPKIRKFLKNESFQERMTTIVNGFIVNRTEIKPYIQDFIDIAVAALNTNKLQIHGIDILANLLVFKFPILKDYDMLNPEDVGKFEGFGKLYKRSEINLEYEEYDPSIISMISNRIADILEKRVSEFNDNDDETRRTTVSIISNLKVPRQTHLPLIGTPIPLSEGEKRLQDVMIHSIKTLLENPIVMENRPMINDVVNGVSNITNQFYYSENYRNKHEKWNKFTSSCRKIEKSTLIFRTIYLRSMYIENCITMLVNHTVPEKFDELNDVFEKLVTCDSSLISNRVLSALTTNFRSTEFLNALFEKYFALLQKADISRVECYSYMNFIMMILSRLNYNDPSQITKFFRFIVNFKFNPNWHHADVYKKIVAKFIEYFNIDKIRGPELDQLVKELPSLETNHNKSTIYEFYHRLASCMYTLPENVIKSVIEASITPTEVSYMQSRKIMYIILKYSCPRPKKVFTAENPEFYDKCIIDYCKKQDSYPHDDFSELVCKYPDFKCFQELLKSTFTPDFVEKFINGFILLKSDNNTIVYSAEAKLWYYLANYLSDECIDRISQLLPKLLEVESDEASKIIACTIIGGLITSTNHMPKEKSENIYQKILVPCYKPLMNTDPSFSTFVKMYHFISSRISVMRMEFIFPLIVDSIKVGDWKLTNKAIQILDLINTYTHRVYLAKIVQYYIKDILPFFKDFEKVSLKNVGKMANAILHLTKSASFGHDEYKEIFPVLFEQYIDKWPQCEHSLHFFERLIANLTVTQGRVLGPYVYPRLNRIFDFANLKCKNVETLSMVTSMAAAEYPIDIIPLDSLKTLKNGSAGFLWMQREYMMGFAKLLIMQHIFTMPKEMLKYITDEFVEPFLVDENEYVRNAALSLLRVCILMTVPDDENLAEYANKCIENLRTSKENVHVVIAAALIGFVTISNKCPSWLPQLFDEAERKYSARHQYAKMLEDTVKDFWKRHQYHDIPELEEFRYMFKNSYYC